MVQPGQDREPDRWTARPRGDSSSCRHFVECERETRRAIAAGERDMLAQHTDESFRADDVSFRNAGGAVVQVLMRSDFFATEAFFCDHGRHPFLEQRHVRYAGGDLVYYQRRSSPTIRPLRPTSVSLIVVHPSPPLTQPSGGRTTQNSTRLFRPTCLGAQTCAPPSGATALLILSLGTGAHSPSTLTS